MVYKTQAVPKAKKKSKPTAAGEVSLAEILSEVEADNIQPPQEQPNTCPPLDTILHPR